MARLILKREKFGLKKVSLVSLLRDKAGLSFTTAKEYVERLQDGEAVVVNIPSIEEAKRLAQEITNLGARCEIDDGAEDSGSSARRQSR